HCGLDQVRPSGPGAGRRDVAAPPEHGLVTAGESGRHEPEFQEGRDAEPEVRVDHLVDVGERVPYLARALVLVRPVDAGLVAEEPVAPDVPEADLALDQRQRLLVVLSQRKVEPAGADAGAPGVGQPAGRLSGYVDQPCSSW